MNKDYILTKAMEILPERRRKHTEGVIATALHLAKLYGEDEDKALIAATCHDMYRVRDIDELNRLIAYYHIPDKYLGKPELAHSKIAAKALEKDFAIEDKDIILAVEFHTTGRAAMSKLEKIIYLADGIEPGRDYPGVDTIREAAEKDLNLGVLTMLKHSVDYLKENNIPVEKDSLEAIDYLEKEMKEN